MMFKSLFCLTVASLIVFGQLTSTAHAETVVVVPPPLVTTVEGMPIVYTLQRRTARQQRLRNMGVGILILGAGLTFVGTLGVGLTSFTSLFNEDATNDQIHRTEVRGYAATGSILALGQGGMIAGSVLLAASERPDDGAHAWTTPPGWVGVNF